TPLRHLDPALAGRLLATGRFEASTDARRMGEADALLLCVPTGLTASDEPDLGPVRAAAEAAAATLRRGQLVVLESTTYPGTARPSRRPTSSAAMAWAAAATTSSSCCPRAVARPCTCRAATASSWPTRRSAPSARRSPRPR